MIEVLINRIPAQFEAGITLAQALQKQETQPPFAIAINLQFIPRSTYHRTILQAGDNIEIVQPITGG